MVKIIKSQKADKDLIRFVKTASSIFDEYLKSKGFESRIKEVEEFFCDIIYVKQEFYLKINANIHPLDGTNYFNIILGHGSLDWPESDWNSIALWRLKKQIVPEEEAQEYFITGFNKIEQRLSYAKEEVEKYGDKFLQGDLTLFIKVRQELNRQRSPYKIYQKDAEGTLRETLDPVSEKLKKKFS